MISVKRTIIALVLVLSTLLWPSNTTAYSPVYNTTFAIYDNSEVFPVHISITGNNKTIQIGYKRSVYGPYYWARVVKPGIYRVNVVSSTPYLHTCSANGKYISIKLHQVVTVYNECTQ